MVSGWHGNRVFKDCPQWGRGLEDCVPNIDAPGILALKTYQDSQAIKAGFNAAHSVLVIGGGFIGLESRQLLLLGKRVTGGGRRTADGPCCFASGLRIFRYLKVLGAIFD